MFFYEIFQSILDEKGLSIADVARLCGLTDSTVRSIISRKQKKIALEVAFKLSHGLKVSLERLNGMPEPEEKETAASQKEAALLGSFHQLNDEGKDKLVDTADDMVRSGKYDKKTGPSGLVQGA